jgi:hypothetical protein
MRGPRGPLGYRVPGSPAPPPRMGQQPAASSAQHTLNIILTLIERVAAYVVLRRAIIYMYLHISHAARGFLTNTKTKILLFQLYTLTLIFLSIYLLYCMHIRDTVHYYIVIYIIHIIYIYTALSITLTLTNTRGDYGEN